MNPERARGFTPEEKPKKEHLSEANREENILRPDGREDLMREVYEENQAETIDALADLKDEEDGARFELAELSKSMLAASEVDPKKVEQIAERIEVVNGALKDIESRRQDLQGQLEDANDLLQPLKGLTDAEMEESLHDVTFGGITEEETEKAVDKPLDTLASATVVETGESEWVAPEEKPLAEKNWAAEVDRVTPPPLPKKRKKEAAKPPPPPLDALVEAEMRIPPPLPSKRKKAETPPPPPLDALVEAEMRTPKERVPGARAASKAEYELTGDELEVIVPPAPETSGNILKDELDELFEEADRMKQETREETEILPAGSPEQITAQELGDETVVRNEVKALETRMADMHDKGFSQKNLERLLLQKGVNADKLAVSGFYRARVKMKSMFDPKLRVLLEIYDKKTAEITDMQKRIQTGKLRLEDPESYKKLMQDQHKRLRR